MTICWPGLRASMVGALGFQMTFKWPPFMETVRKDLEVNNKETKFIYTKV